MAKCTWKPKGVRDRDGDGAAGMVCLWQTEALLALDMVGVTDKREDELGELSCPRSWGSRPVCIRDLL